MYAKVFRQMYDGTLATNGPWEALVTFQQLLVLANDQGEVDMTAAAIARVTTIPLNIIERGLGVLMAPDPESRTPDEDGRRLVALSDGRSWGWRIVNYIKYRAIQKEEERREYHRRYYHEKRKNKVEPQQRQQISTVSTDSTDTEANTEAEEEAKTKTARKRAPAAPAVTVETLCLDGLAEELAVEYLALRKRKRANLTALAWSAIVAEIRKAGLTLDEGITKALARGWTGFDASWVTGSAGRQQALEDHNLAVAREWAKGGT